MQPTPNQLPIVDQQRVTGVNPEPEAEIENDLLQDEAGTTYYSERALRLATRGGPRKKGDVKHHLLRAASGTLQ